MLKIFTYCDDITKAYQILNAVGYNLSPCRERWHRSEQYNFTATAAMCENLYQANTITTYDIFEKKCILYDNLHSKLRTVSKWQK